MENNAENISLNDLALTPIIIVAIQNDKLLKELYDELLKLTISEIPKFIQISGKEFNTIYSDEFYLSRYKIYEQIKLRENQIINFYTK